MATFNSTLAQGSGRLSLRLALNGAAVAILLTIITSVLEFALDVRSRTREIDADLKQIFDTVYLTARSSVFSYDYVQGQEIVQTLVASDFIVTAEIVDENNELIAAGVSASPQPTQNKLFQWWLGDQLQWAEYPLVIYDSNGVAGKLRVQYDRHLPYQQLIQDSLLAFLFHAIQLSVLTFALVLIFNRLITKPLEKITLQLSNIDLHNSQGQRVENDPNRPRDEITTLTEAINTQIVTVEQLISENTETLNAVTAAQDSLRNLIDSLPYMVSLKSLEGYGLLANKNFCDVLGIRTDEFSGEATNELYKRSMPHSIRDVIKVTDQDVAETGKTRHLKDVSFTLPDGEELVVELTKILVTFEGKPAILTVAIDVTERISQQAYIRFLAYHDPLTQLPNRHRFIETLGQAILSSRRSHQYGALLLVNLDDFKAINDTESHDVGDAILIQIAQRLSSFVTDDQAVARLGNDEFVVKQFELGMTETIASTAATEHANNILTELRNGIRVQGKNLKLSASIGITLFQSSDISATDLLKQADLAMNQAKKSGKNRIVFYSDEMGEATRQFYKFTEECLNAIREKQFYLLYQPQYDSHSKKIVGCEALLRWRHPIRGNLSPAEFIPMLESSDMMPKVGQFVLEQVIEAAEAWFSKGLLSDPFKISINVSPSQFGLAEFSENFKQIITQSTVPSELIVLEITETMIIEHIDRTIETMKELKSHGIRFSIDDFGTGYSSLNYLKRLPLDQLKVDGSFIRDIENDPNDLAIVRTIVAMADQLNLDIIAEGVETSEQLKILQSMSCFQFQGYLFSPPLSHEEITQLFNNQVHTTSAI